jgi:hypothetical protein
MIVDISVFIMIVDINASVLQGSETGGYEEMELTKTKWVPMTT